MITVVLVIHLIIAIAMVGVILLQRSEGGALGIGGGGGGGGGVVSGRAAGNILTRSTGILGTLFFITSLTMAVMANEGGNAPSIVDEAVNPAPGAEAPASLPTAAPDETTPQAPTAPSASGEPSAPIAN